MSGDFDVEAEMEAMAAEEAAAAVQEEPEEEEVIGPLVISDAHSSFSLDKITEADDTLGEYNPRHLHCEFCGIIILLEGSCCKVKKRGKPTQQHSKRVRLALNLLARRRYAQVLQCGNSPARRRPQIFVLLLLLVEHPRLPSNQRSIPVLYCLRQGKTRNLKTVSYNLIFS